MPLTEKEKEVSAFVIPDGLYQCKVMQFGLRNALTTFQQFINNLIADVPECKAYIDHVVVYSDTWNSHLSKIHKFLITSFQECNWSCSSLIPLPCLGGGEVKPITAKMDVINHFPVPNNKKELMRLSGMAGYYR